MTIGLAAIALVVLFVAYRLVPGQLPNAQYLVADAAYAECLHESALHTRSGCQNTGYPAGAPKPFGLPLNFVASAMFAGDGTVSASEMAVVYGLVLVLAFCLAWKLFSTVTQSRRLGLCGALLFLLAPAVRLQSSFGALQLGMALIPGYLLIDAMLLSALGGGQGVVRWKQPPRRRRIAGVFLLIVAVRVFSVFLDGYSFLLSSLLSAMFFAVSALRRDGRASALGSLGLFVVACAVAVLAYRQYLDAAALAVMPTDFFRGAGVDVATMLAPLRWQGGWGLLGIGLDVSPEMTYGGRSSLLGTFIGVSYLVAAIVLAWWVLTRRTAIGALPAAMIGAGALALLLSLGPSLKFMDFKSKDTAPAVVEFQDRLMPAEAARADLHTGWIYQKVPGIRNARVLARWQVLTRLAWVVALMLVVARLAKTRRPLAAALLLLGLFEILPDPMANAREGVAAYQRAQLLERDYPIAFASGLRPDERVFLVQLHDGAGGNEYAANTLCVRARVRCYNTGGDKASLIVRSAWPREILDAASGRQVAANLRAAFGKGSVDVIAVPYFDLRDIVYPQRPGTVPEAQVRERAGRLAADMHASIVYRDRFAYLRPKRD